jgi:hypothetical protein
MASPRLKPGDVIAEPTSPVESAKRAAARSAVDAWVRTGMRVGVGSGSTIVYAIQRLAERVHGDEKLDIVCVPTSFQARNVSPYQSAARRHDPPGDGSNLGAHGVTPLPDARTRDIVRTSIQPAPISASSKWLSMTSQPTLIPLTFP